MAPFDRNVGALHNLAGKVIVVTGGAGGMAFPVVRSLHENGAHVVFGDEAVGQCLEFTEQFDQSCARLDFVPTDVTDYSDVVNLFQKAYAIHGKIDHAVDCSNVIGDSALLLQNPTIENIQVEPDIRPLEVNLKGAVYFARVALAYLRHDNDGSHDKSLTFLSSTIIFTGTCNSPLYQISKDGILQLMRTLRPLPPTITKAPVRINAVCPSVTAFPCIDSWLVEEWRKVGMVVNETLDVARVILSVVAQPEISGINGNMRQLHGSAITCCGNECWEFEENLQQDVECWIGCQSWENITQIRQMMKRLNLPVWGPNDTSTEMRSCPIAYTA